MLILCGEKIHNSRRIFSWVVPHYINVVHVFTLGIMMDKPHNKFNPIEGRQEYSKLVVYRKAFVQVVLIFHNYVAFRFTLLMVHSVDVFVLRILVHDSVYDPSCGHPLVVQYWIRVLFPVYMPKRLVREKCISSQFYT